MIKDIFFMIITGVILSLLYYIIRLFVMLFIARIKQKKYDFSEEETIEKGYIVSSTKIMLAFTIIFLSIPLILLCYLLNQVMNNNSIIISNVIIISSTATSCLIGGVLLLLYYKNRNFYIYKDKIISQSMFLKQKEYYINQLHVKEINGAYGMVFIVYNDDQKKIFKIEEIAMKNSRILLEDIKRLNFNRIQEQLESGTYF